VKKFAVQILALTAVTGLAQQPQRQDFPLESLRVTGNKEIPADRIAAASGLKIGRTVVKSDFDAARQRLLDTGAFENVGYEYKPSADNAGYDAVFEVREIGEFFPYRFEDLPVGDAALRETLHKQEPLLGDRIPVTAAVIERYIKAVEQAAGVTVTGKLESGANGELAVLFRPAASRPIIAEVRFRGNDAVPSALLMRTIAPVAIGTPYTETNIRQRLDASIRPLYDARGRIRVSFPKIVAEKAVNAEGVIVTVDIDEGASYTWGEIPAEVSKVADLKKGDIANFDDLKAGLDKINRGYRNNGYLHVTSEAMRDIHDDTHTVNLSLNVNRGPQYHFGKLQIQGLDILSEPPIRKAWGPMEGKPYQPDYAEAFLSRLRAEEVFDNLGKTRAETSTDEASKTVDVTLYFSGAAPEPKKRPGPAPVQIPDPPIW
jgi:outer membrane protein assembly factor BamA